MSPDSPSRPKNFFSPLRGNQNLLGTPLKPVKFWAGSAPEALICTIFASPEKLRDRQGWTGMYTLVLHLCPRKLPKIATRICQLSQYLRTKLDMLFVIAKSVEIVRILRRKQLFYAKLLISCKNTILLLLLST